MRTIEKLYRKLAFDKAYDRFELTERESGVPGASRDSKKSETDEHDNSQLVPASVHETESLLKKVFNAEINTDLIIRTFHTGNGSNALAAYMNGMANDETISRFILEPLMNCENEWGTDYTAILNDVLRVAETTVECNFKEIITSIIAGKTALFVDGTCAAIVLETRGFEKRSVSEAQNERIVLGPKEGFTENLRTNITLIRRIIKTPDLVAEYRPAGGENNTLLAIVYRKEFTNNRLIEEVKNRLKEIDLKLVASTGVLDQLIEDKHLIPIPETLSTERPDRAASFVMQGAVAVIPEGSPFALILPATLSALMSSPEDTYLRPPLGSLLRVVRYIGAGVSVILPAYFVSLAMYHQGLLSTEVLSTIIKSREMVFEPLPIEMLLLLFVFQLIREAGMRVPGSIGQAIGVIGGLILGQAAVAANLASTVLLIIVAISGLGNLCIPDYSTQITVSYFRLVLVLAAWVAGLLGVTAVLMVSVALLANMKSFGVPFLTPFAPKTFSNRPYILRGRIDHSRADDYFNTDDEVKDN